jgi:hypothetical protein
MGEKKNKKELLSWNKLLEWIATIEYEQF